MLQGIGKNNYVIVEQSCSACHLEIRMTGPRYQTPTNTSTYKRDWLVFTFRTLRTEMPLQGMRKDCWVPCFVPERTAHPLWHQKSTFSHPIHEKGHYTTFWEYLLKPHESYATKRYNVSHLMRRTCSGRPRTIQDNFLHTGKWSFGDIHS